MINFDAVDFSERRSEEVISFFLRSVYVNLFFVNQICLQTDQKQDQESLNSSHKYLRTWHITALVKRKLIPTYRKLSSL